ncbi:MAG: LLM class flavin-dependent oxidoreductase, partial [Chloroflexota bacterium]|nr:LLM class flavin-dependent oxidoreductase [Chloroflexota bacterium]
MPDVQFGFCLPIFASPGINLFRAPGYAELDALVTMELGRLADALGYDSLWVADHLMLGKDDAILEGWTVLAALAGATSRAKLGMIHQANYFRHPALAAKMSATLDQISGGRLIHFLDCGYMRREYVNYDLPWNDDLDRRIADLIEATELILALWTTDGPVTHTGQTYHVDNAILNPKPVQQPHPPLWFGEATPGILDACARYGQGWNTTPVSIPELRTRLAALDAACERAGRSRSELELSLETQILIAPDLDSLRERLRWMVELATGGQPLPDDIQPFLDRYAEHAGLLRFVRGETDELPAKLAVDWLIGTPDQIARRLRDYIAEGISHFLLWFMDAPNTDGMRLFASEVAPRFRQRQPAWA